MNRYLTTVDILHCCEVGTSPTVGLEPHFRHAVNPELGAWPDRVVGGQMLRLKCLVAACVLAVSVGQVKANTFTTFDAFGSFTDVFHDTFALSGSITVDSTSSAVISNASLFLVGEPWTNIVGQSGSNLSIQTPIFNVGFSPSNCTTTNGCHDTLNLLFSGEPSIWLADDGASILSGSAFLRDAGFSIHLVSGGISEQISAIPLPAALPLFASGLAVLGLFGWWRTGKNKRKNGGGRTANVRY
jgi:hypothetical protein